MDFFKSYGDRIFTFIALASVTMQGLDYLPGWVNHLILVSGMLATAAHQSFFPNQPGVPK